MWGWRRSFWLGLLIASLLAAPAVAVALDDGSAVLLAVSEEGDEEPAPVNDSGVVPAIEAPSAEAEEEDQPWTARYLAPTVLALAVVALFASGGYYVVRIRGKYRVVD